MGKRSSDERIWSGALVCGPEALQHYGVVDMDLKGGLILQKTKAF